MGESSISERLRAPLERAIARVEGAATAENAQAVVCLAQATLAAEALERRQGPGAGELAAARTQLLRCAAVLEAITPRRGRLTPEGPVEAGFEPTPGELQELLVAPAEVQEVEPNELRALASRL